MDINESRRCNQYNLTALASYLAIEQEILIGYYNELIEDCFFLDQINGRIKWVVENTNFNKGIFAKRTVPSVDWFAFERILIYVLIRHFKPQVILETGVYYGGNTAFALAALKKNECGKMISIDLPDHEIKEKKSHERHPLVGDSELYEPTMNPGFIVPKYLDNRWELILGDSLVEIPRLEYEFDLYMHDSDHSMPFLSKELEVVWGKLSPSAVMLVDDIDWSNAFFSFCSHKKLLPLLLTDNGKDNLRVRTGVVSINHPKNGDPMFT